MFPKDEDVPDTEGLRDTVQQAREVLKSADQSNRAADSPAQSAPEQGTGAAGPSLQAACAEPAPGEAGSPQRNHGQEGVCIVAAGSQWGGGEAGSRQAGEKLPCTPPAPDTAGTPRRRSISTGSRAAADVLVAMAAGSLLSVAAPAHQSPRRHGQPQGGCTMTASGSMAAPSGVQRRQKSTYSRKEPAVKRRCL